MKVGEIWQLKSDIQSMSQRILITGIRYEKTIKTSGEHNHHDDMVYYCSTSKPFNYCQELMREPFKKGNGKKMSRSLLLRDYYSVHNLVST